MTPLTSSWGPFAKEFLCGGCGGRRAYRSRPRGFFERRVLPLLMLQPVRCDHCYHRAYISKFVAVLERAQRTAGKNTSGVSDASSAPGRVA